MRNLDGTKKVLFVILLAVALLLIFQVSVVHAQDGQGEVTPLELPKLSADLLITLTGAALSILAYVIPPIRRLQERAGEWTPAYMAGALLVVAVVYQFIQCSYVFFCLAANLQPVVMIWLGAVATNFGAYKAVIKPAKMRGAADA
jgi:hypothetical protein